ncbi:MAG: hypothetical protein FJX72_02035, partial [Armatimonadetes bacterium]|nr:hypothetical protein [Armatimonadota bacterium]
MAPTGAPAPPTSSECGTSPLAAPPSRTSSEPRQSPLVAPASRRQPGIVLGVDIGTTSAKCLAVAEDGRVLAFAQRAYPMSQPYEGWAEQDAEEYYRALVDVVQRCVAQCGTTGRSASDIRAMALSTQADTLIIADQAGHALRPAISWMARAPGECRELTEAFGEAFWRAHMGQALTPYSSACKIRRLQRDEPDLMASGPRPAYVPDFLNHRLTGRWVNDVPSASWSPFFVPVKRAPSMAVMDAVGVAEDQLSPAVESGAPIGEILPAVCAELGLADGTLLMAGAFDQTAAAYGAGAAAGGTSVLSCGTAWVLYAVADRPPAGDDPITPSLALPRQGGGDRVGFAASLRGGGDAVGDESGSFRLCACCHVRAEEWGLVLPFTGGSAYDWVTRNMAQGASASESAPLIFVPHLYGGLSPDWQEQSKGSILGLTLSHTAEDIRMALMRGLAFETRRNVEAAAPHVGRPQTLRMVGGATHSEVWPQMIADAVGCSVEVASLTETACYGAARLAAGAALCEWSPEGQGAVRVFEPDGADVAAMNRLC